jgi:hypothetical protein
LLFGHKTDLITKPIVARLSKPKTHMPANHNICFMSVFSIKDSLYDGNGPGHNCQYHGKSKQLLALLKP